MERVVLFSSLIIWAVVLFGVGPAFVVYALHRRKATSTDLRVIGRTGVAKTVLDPEGSVLVDGELWRARISPHCLRDHNLAQPNSLLRRPIETIESGTVLRVVGSFNHLLLVEMMA